MAQILKKIAKQFSQAASASNGGDVGWLGENQIPKELLDEIKKTGIGKIIGPVKSIEGYFILEVKEVRTVDTKELDQVLSLKHFEIRYNNAKDAQSAAKKAATINDTVKGCSKEAQNYADTIGAILQDYGSVQLKDLQPSIRKIIIDLPTGHYSQPYDSGTSFLTFLVCSRTDNTKIPDDVQRDKARQALFKRQLELEARAYLRNLRNNTNIEIKME